jgi:hypothetical protein
MNVQIKGSDGLVSIDVIDYENTAAETPEDANWLSCYITVKAGVFAGEYQASLTTHDFVDFQQQLARAVERLEGAACFETMEDVLRIAVDVKSNGHALISGIARSVGAGRTHLTFEITSDQSCLSETNSQLQAIVQTFPTKAG